MKGHVKNKLHPRQLPQGARQLAPSPLGVACVLPFLLQALLPETRLLLRLGVLAEWVASVADHGSIGGSGPTAISGHARGHTVPQGPQA